VGLWQLDGSLVDSSGNGFTLTASGTNAPRYTDLMPGLRGGVTDIVDDLRFERTVNDAALDISGDLTIEVLISARNVPTATAMEILSMGSTTDTAYRMLFTEHRTSFIHKAASSQNSVDFFEQIPPRQPSHLAFRRSGTDISLFLNGVLIDTLAIAGSAAANAASRFRIGRGDLDANDLDAIVASVKVIASALTDDEIKAEYNRTLGPVYGVL